MNKNQKILLIVLVVVAGYLGYDIFTNPTGSTAKRAASTVRNISAQATAVSQPKTPQTKINVAALVAQKTNEINKMPHYAEIWGRDPFIGELFDMSDTKITGDETNDNTPRAPVYLEEYKLNAISYRGETPTVLIDKEIMRIGDKIDGMTLVDVKGNFAILTDGNQKYIIKLKGSL